MDPLVELPSRKAARILDATRALVLDHGAGKVTVTEIARAAGVGKGTVYLSWRSKEDLILNLFARDLLSGVDAALDYLAADPSNVLPARLAPFVTRLAQLDPLRRLLDNGDADLLRLLTTDPRDRDLFARTTSTAMGGAVIPVLRRHGLLRDDQPLGDQIHTMHALITGFTTTAPGPSTDPHRLLADAVTALFAPVSPPSADDIAAASTELMTDFRSTRDTVIDLVRRSQNTPGGQPEPEHHS